MLRQLVSILIVFELCSLCCTSVGSASEHLQWSELPAAVKATFLKRYPHGKMEIAYFTDDEVFDITLKNKNQVMSIRLKEDGAVKEISINVPAADLPMSVTSILQKKYPKSEVTFACELYAVRKGKDVLTAYHIELTTKGHGRRIMKIERNGTVSTDYVDTTEFVEPLSPTAPPKAK